ncbi:hypothetical protein M1146_00495 [Patescibacteria group bacterium]|nr:hypothetical protein [Patescibacteria group bacterium]
MSKSRLSRRVENQSRKNLFLSILGIIIVLILLVKFGIPLLVNFSLLISGSNGPKEQTAHTKAVFINPPLLNSTLAATNSAKITVSGTAVSNQTIGLYLNDNLIDKTEADSNGSFSFDFTLNSGENKIKTKASKNGKESEFSNTLSVVYASSPPSLEVKSPTDGQSFSKDQNTTQVTGKTDADVKVTVNGFWAIIDENNNFSYNLSLQNGDNQIKIVATDGAGNKTEKGIKVNYSP